MESLVLIMSCGVLLLHFLQPAIARGALKVPLALLLSCQGALNGWLWISDARSVRYLWASALIPGTVMILALAMAGFAKSNNSRSANRYFWAAVLILFGVIIMGYLLPRPAIIV